MKWIASMLRTLAGARPLTPRQRRNRLLFWCAVTIMGVLVWLLSDRVVPAPK